MKLPGDKGRQGIDIEQLEVDPEMSMEEALKLGDELGADEPGADYLKVIDFRQNDIFLHEDEDGDERVYKVVSDRNWTRQLHVAPPYAQPGETEYERAPAWDEFARYDELWLAWLQGRVVPVKSEVRYIRTDTGEEVEVNP